MPTTSKVVEQALERFKVAVDAEQEQRDREQEDLRFQVPELQWEDEAKTSRLGTTIDGVQVPPRPMISIPKLDQPIQLVLNQEKAAHLGVNVHPLSEDADDDTAEVIQGLYRRIERDSRAGLARSWAFDRAVKVGRGAYRVNTTFDDEGGFPFDQKITIQRLLYQESAYFDPFAQEPDWSDGEWAFVAVWKAWDRYQKKYPESELTQGGDSAFTELMATMPDWIKGDGEARAVLLVEYFRKEYTPRAWVILDDGSFAFEDEIPKGRAILMKKDGTPFQRREVEWPKVVWSLINAVEELDTEDWNGKYIPLIPVIGRELQPFDGKRRWTGIIGPAKGAARMFNYAASSAIELAALEPKAPYQMYDGQQEGHESMWQQANIRNFPYMLSNAISLPGGGVAPLPQRTQTDVSKLGPSMLLLDKADQFIQAATSNIDPSALERLANKRVAHQTIGNLADQGGQSNSHFLYNLAEISMTYEAKVVIDLMAKVYDRPGRVARILDFEDNEQTVILNQPFVSQDGKPQPVPEGMPPPKNVKQFDLTKGVYGVSVDIGKSWQTRLQQGADEIGAVLTASPEMLPLIGATYFKFRDFPGSKEIAEILKKVRVKQYPDLEGEEDGEPDAEQLKAQLGQATQQIQVMGQQLQQAMQALETEQAKQQAQLQKAQMDNATKAAIAEGQAQNKIALERMEQQFALLMAKMEQAHEMRLAEQKGEQAREMADRGALETMAQSESSGNGGGA